MRPPEFWSRPPGVLATALTPLGWLYAAVGWARRKVRPTDHVGVPVICVGNLVLGGAGKTPVAIDLGQRLSHRGHAVHFLTRGYGGSLSGPLRVDAKSHTAADVGDEALLLARHAPTWMSADRPAGARAAVAAGAAVIVMDDGFQNPSLAKDVSLIVVDAGVGFGNGRVFPAGPLREPVSCGLSRADAVVAIGAGAVDAGTRPVLRATIAADEGDAPLKGQRVLAFAGIGRPEKFFATLRDLGADVVSTCAFDDHYPYTAADLDILNASAQAADAQLITTEKDVVRLPQTHKDTVRLLPISLVWDEPHDVDALLHAVMEAPHD